MRVVVSSKFARVVCGGDITKIRPNAATVSEGHSESAPQSRIVSFPYLEPFLINRETDSERVHQFLERAADEVRYRLSPLLQAPLVYIYPFVLSFRQDNDRMNWGGPRLHPFRKPLTSFWRNVPASCNTWLGLVYEPPKWVRKTTYDSEGLPWRWWAFALVKRQGSKSRTLLIFDVRAKICSDTTRPKHLTPAQHHLWRFCRNDGKLRMQSKRQVDFYYHQRHFRDIGRSDLSLTFYWLRLMAIIEHLITDDQDIRLNNCVKIWRS
jgi:hypothetical protein